MCLPHTPRLSHRGVVRSQPPCQQKHVRGTPCAQLAEVTTQHKDSGSAQLRVPAQVVLSRPPLRPHTALRSIPPPILDSQRSGPYSLTL